MRSKIAYAWRFLALGAILASPVAPLGCGESSVDSVHSRDLSYAASAGREDGDEACDPDDVADLIEAIEALSDWEFDDDADTTHPRYCDIVREQYAALQKYLELGIDKLVFAEITIKIVNEKHPDGYAAYTEVHRDGSSTITFYNPDA